MQTKKWIKLFIIIFTVSGILLIAPAGFAQDPQDDAAFNCASAVDTTDCIKQTNPNAIKSAEITAIPINSQTLGFAGPLNAGLRYDNYLAWILDVGYAQEFYDAAAAFKLSAGLNERRANVTLGYAITPKQQIKLTYEYLAQNLPFDYASGTVNEWVHQNAFGAAYRYMLDYGILRALEVYGTYTKASSKELSEVEMYTDNLLTQINYRRIAGGTEKTAGATFTLTPFKGTIVKVGGGYSTLSFDTQWENSEDTAALVYNAEISHLLTPTTLITTGIGNTASGRTHTAKISQILPWSLEASVVGQYTATTNDIPSSTSVTASLSYPAPKTYTNLFAADIGKLKNWIEKPVLYHSRVLAKAEERLVAVQITTLPIPAAPIPVGADITPIETKNYFVFNQEVFDKINYRIAAITLQSNNQPANTNLNLQVVPVDSFNAKLVSAAPATVEMMTPGDYIVTLQAQGYRKGAIVSQIDNPVAVNVTANASLAAPTWKTDKSLPSVITATEYPTVDLQEYVQTQSTLDQSEVYTFKFSGKHPDWITLSKDQKSLTANGPAGAPGTATVTLIATSLASGNSTAANAFPITVSPPEATAPVWVADPITVNIPYNSAQTHYQLEVGSSAYVSDNPDISEMKIPSGGNLPSNGIQLGVTEIENKYYVSIDISHAGDIGTPGQFSVVATNKNDPAKKTTGNFIINLTPDETAQPTWIPGAQLPAATVNTYYPTTDLRQLVTDNSGVSTSGYTFTLADNPAWLTLSADKKSLIANGHVQPNPGSVTLKLVATNAFNQSTAPTTFTIDVAAAETPAWNSSLIISQPYYTGSHAVYIFKAGDAAQSYVSPLTGESTVNLIGPYHITNLPSGSIPSELNHPGNDWYLDINTNDLRDVNHSGEFTIKATGSNNEPSYGYFTVKIIPNSHLTAATTNSANSLPNAEYNSSTPYNVVLDPYKGNSNQITPTTNGVTTVPDELTFKSISPEGASNPVCTWVELVGGVLQQKAGVAVNGADCWVAYSVSSTATGTTFHFIKKITVGAPPVWITTQLNQSIKFDDTTDGILLNHLIDSAGANAPDLRFTFANHSTVFGDWKIESTANTYPAPNSYYLRRIGADAADVGETPISLNILAFNSHTVAGVQGSLAMTVQPDSDLFIKWMPEDYAITFKVNETLSYTVNPHIQSCVDENCTTVVANDAITYIDTGNLLTLPSGKKIALTKNADNYVLHTTDSIIMPYTDAGSYDLVFNNVRTKAKGSSPTELTGKLIVTPSDDVAPTWKAGMSLPAVTTNTAYPITPLTPYVDNNNTGTIGDETYTFQLSGNNNPAWVTLSEDKRSLISNGTSVAPAPGTAALVTLIATSDQTGKSTAPNAYPITILHAAPTWTADPIVVNLPYNPAQTSYPLEVSSSDYVSGNVNISDMNIVPGQNLPSNGIQSGVTEIGAKYYVTIDLSHATDIGAPGQFSVVAANPDDLTKSATGHFTIHIVPNETAQPAWVAGAQLPTVTVKTNYPSIDLTTLVTDNSGMPTSGYTFTLSNHPAWLSLSQDKKNLIANGPAPATPGNVTVTLIGTNSFNQSTPPQTFNIEVISAETPQWNSSLVINQLYYSGINSVYLFKANDPAQSFVAPNSGETTVMLSGPTEITDLPSLTLPKELIHSGNDWSVNINSNHIQDIGAAGRFTIEASGSNNEPSYGYFTVNILPNPNLTPPSVSTTALPEAQYNSSTRYTHTLDPYAGATDQITPTKTASGATVDDQLSFTATTPLESGRPLCTWTEVANGVLQQKQNVAVSGSDCWVVYLVHSKATDTSVRFEKSISVGSPPVWTAGQLDQNIKFDDTSGGILLNSLIDSAGAHDPDLHFTFTNNSTSVGDWKIESTHNVYPAPNNYYLRRVGANAAGISDTPVSLNILAFNSHTNTGVQGTLSLTIQADNNLFLKWLPNGYTIDTTIPSPAIGLTTANIKACVDQDCQQMVTNDSITHIDPGTAFTLPSGQTGTISLTAGQYSLQTPNTIPNSDAGTYTATLNNVRTKAKGASADGVTLSPAIMINREPADTESKPVSYLCIFSPWKPELCSSAVTIIEIDTSQYTPNIPYILNVTVTYPPMYPDTYPNYSVCNRRIDNADDALNCLVYPDNALGYMPITNTTVRFTSPIASVVIAISPLDLANPQFTTINSLKIERQ